MSEMEEYELNNLIIEAARRVIDDMNELISWIRYGKHSGEYDDKLNLIDCVRVDILEIRHYVKLRDEEK